MDDKHRRRKKRLREEETDMLGSARMVTNEGQPFLDDRGEKAYMARDKEKRQKKNGS